MVEAVDTFIEEINSNRDEQENECQDDWDNWSDDNVFDTGSEEPKEELLTIEELQAQQQRNQQPCGTLVQELKNQQQIKSSTTNPVAVQRIIGELQLLSGEDMKKFGYRVAVNEENIFQWSVYLTDFPNDSQLYRDLLKVTKKEVELEVTFPSDFPFTPPFIRVIRPRFQYLTGHITVGGSVCMEVLTRSGWVPSYTLEGLLMQIKSEIVEGGARVDLGNQLPYSKTEAEEAFRRVAGRYGWQ